MHDTAMKHGKLFFDAYVKKAANLTIVDIGALDVNGSLRSVAPADNKYVGVDFANGRGVDVLITDPYKLPFKKDSVDVVVSSSCFEHSEFFWLSFNEIQRILKPSGLLYLNAPSNGPFHKFPVDCYRFYPDSGIALQNWARKSGYKTTMLESFIGKQDRGMWNDFVGVFVKDGKFASKYPSRIQDNYSNYTNGLRLGSTDYTNYSEKTEDQKFDLAKRITGLFRKNI